MKHALILKVWPVPRHTYCNATLNSIEKCSGNEKDVWESMSVCFIIQWNHICVKKFLIFDKLFNLKIIQ